MEVKRRTARTLVKKLSSVSEQTRAEALCELRLISKNDADSRTIIAEAGAVPYLAEALYSSSHDFQENAATTLLNLSISSPTGGGETPDCTRRTIISTRGVLDAISHLLINHQHSAAAAVQSAAATLHSLLILEDSYRPLIGGKRDILYALIDIIRCHNSPPRSIKDALKALFGVSLYTQNRAAVIELGAVPPLFSLVVLDGRVGFVEDATAVIAQIAGCEEGVEAFRKASAVGVLVDLLDPATGSTGRIKENAVSALLNLVQCGGQRLADDIRKETLGLYAWINDVAENGSAKGKSKAGALLNLLGGGSYGFRETRLFPSPQST
ncbi:Armadillo [Dillenia turbinata]|uniref:Armadillo n=1 Tax=Dillenia turbinata TaxID=194707 RepID=A0AAN8V7B4_9MAGN